LLGQANSIGGPRSKTVREYLEKHYSAEAVADLRGAQKLAVKALLEVVQSGGKNIELACMQRGGKLVVRPARPTPPPYP
jgi:20S proteasome subunit alpha 4